MRPNLLFLYTDEQARNTLAAYGNRQIQMPNLNRLAAESVVFNNAYVTQPVCTPSRSSLLTGLYPHTNGCTENNVPLRPDTPCLPEMVARQEYVSGHFGKWHLGDELFAQHGFDEWVSIEDSYNRYFSKGRDRDAASNYHHFLIQNGLTPMNGRRFGRDEAARLPEALCKPAFLAREASRFIQANRNRPFILYVNFLEPHMPFFGPRDNQYPPETVPLPPNFKNEPTLGQPLKTRLLKQHYLRNEAEWRRVIANYWGLCSLVDTHAGAILDTVDECGLRNKTIVVFTSDHGDMMGARQLLAKCVMFQEVVRVPMLIRLPGQACAKCVANPVSQIDLVPTLLDLMGQSVPDHLQGRSLRAVVQSNRPPASAPVFIEWNGPNNGVGGDVLGSVQIPDWMTKIASPSRIRAAMTDPVRTVITPNGWKLNWSTLGEHELYHLEKDPFETQNLFGKKENRSIIRECAAAIRGWQKQTQDKVALPDL